MTRSTAAARREQIVAASIKRFATAGFHGTSTEDIADDVELSQPYLFRLFGTKRDLFLACCDACDERIRNAFADACTGDTPEERLRSMGMAYRQLLADEHMLRFQLQMYAAAGDPEIRTPVAANYRALLDDLRVRSGATEDDTIRFVSIGMFLNVATSLGLDDVLASWRGEA
jgi:AcrR family transcriptional regulator